MRRQRRIGPGLAATVTVLLSTWSSHGARAVAQEEERPRDSQVVGVVVHGDGVPAAEVPVRIVATDTGLSGALAGLFTLGLACLASDVCSSDGDDIGATTTDDAGRYSAPLPDSYVPGTETDTDWLVTASRRAEAGQVAGPSSTFEFEVNAAQQDAPPLPLWDATPAATTTGWRVSFRAEGMPAGVADPRVVLTTGSVTSVSVDGSVAEEDLRRIEPEAGFDAQHIFMAATAYADVRVAHAEGRTIYHQRVSTAAPDIGLAPHQLVPPSRGTSCAYSLVDGTTHHAERCPLTDGSFSSVLHDPEQRERAVVAATVELPAPIELADVFVRGCDAACVVEASGDGTTWGGLANDPVASRPGDGGFRSSLLVSSLRPPLPARFVRVSRPNGLAATQVSAWPPAPAPAIAPATPSPAEAAARDETGAAGDRGADDSAGASGRSAAPAVAAALLLVAVLAAAFVAAWRR